MKLASHLTAVRYSCYVAATLLCTLAVVEYARAATYSNLHPGPQETTACINLGTMCDPGLFVRNDDYRLFDTWECTYQYGTNELVQSKLVGDCQWRHVGCCWYEHTDYCPTEPYVCPSHGYPPPPE